MNFKGRVMFALGVGDANGAFNTAVKLGYCLGRLTLERLERQDIVILLQKVNNQDMAHVHVARGFGCLLGP